MLRVSTYEPGEIAIKAGETTAKLLFLGKGAGGGCQRGNADRPDFRTGTRYSASWPLCWVSPIQLTCESSNVRNSVSPTQRLCLQAIRWPRFTLRLILAGRLDAANGALVEVKRQLETGQPGAAVVQTVDKIAELLTNESFAEDLFLDELIAKPWGREYRIYADNFYDVWKLELGPGRATSLHYHPRKDTVLMCLGGHGRIQLADTYIDILAGKHFFIGRGVSHATTNVGEDELELIEVEHPRNKFDLVRVQDSYGRASQPYESMRYWQRGSTRGRSKYDGIPGAKYRHADIDGHYRFTIGKPWRERMTSSFLVAVPVGLQSVTGDIEIVERGRSRWRRVTSETEPCFTISVWQLREAPRRQRSRGQTSKGMKHAEGCHRHRPRFPGPRCGLHLLPVEGRRL